MEKKKVTINISQVQTLCFLLKQQISETEVLAKHDKYMLSLLETYKDLLIKLYYISESEHGITFEETEESFNTKRKWIKECLATEKSLEKDNEYYMQHLKEVFG